MHPNLFISTGAFGRQALSDVLVTAAKEGIPNIELSSDAHYEDRMWSGVLEACRRGSLRFLIHNYFPTPVVPFVLNLASNDRQTLELSRAHCVRAMNMCVEVGSPFYSVHAGFCFHAGPADLGKKQLDLPRIAPSEAERIFIESLDMLLEHAEKIGIRLLIENNVLAPFNVVNGRNEMFLAVTAEETLRLLDGVKKKDRLGLLLDVGHLKVSAESLGFDRERFIDLLLPRIGGLHLSENNGRVDNNQKVTADSWFWGPLIGRLPEETYWVLEVYRLSAADIHSQTKIIESFLATAAHE